MKIVSATFLVVLLLLTGCASPYVVTQNVNDLSKKLSDKQAVEILSENLPLNKSTGGYGLCMGVDFSGADWIMAASTKQNFKINSKKAEFSVLEFGSFRSKVVRTGIGYHVVSDRELQPAVKTIIFKDIDRINIDEVSWNHKCGLWRNAGYIIQLNETENKLTVVVIKENRFDEFIAAILKLNSNKQLKIYK